jgi:hypothetical protein
MLPRGRAWAIDFLRIAPASIQTLFVDVEMTVAAFFRALHCRCEHLRSFQSGSARPVMLSDRRQGGAYRHIVDFPVATLRCRLGVTASGTFFQRRLELGHLDEGLSAVR